jgi:hypothetical protein
MASARSLVRGLPHLGSSENEVLVLPSAKPLHSFFIVEKAGASVSETGLNSVAIAEARRPLSVRKWMIARCSINILKVDVLNAQARIDILQTSARADVVGTTKIFEREIGEEEIICRIKSFSMISAHHWVR